MQSGMLGILAPTGIGNLRYRPPGRGARTRTGQDRLRDRISVKDFAGIDPTGVSDSTAAIQAAITAGPGKDIQLGDGTFQITGLTISSAFTRLLGNGPGRTVLRMTNASTAAITLAAALDTFAVGGMTITRTPTATSGGDGIKQLGAVGTSQLFDLIIDKQYNGLNLSTTDWSLGSRIIVQRCQNVGVLIAPTPTDGACQWNFTDVLSQKNASHGFLVLAPASGPAGISLGEWVNCATFANTQAGMAFSDTAAVPISGVRLVGCFNGANGSSNFYFDTRGQASHLTGCSSELAGTTATGPTLSTAASNTGDGYEFTANNLEILMVGCTSDGNSLSGVKTSATRCVMTGCVMTDNGLAALAANRNGVLQLAGSLVMSGSRCGNNSGGTSQSFGISFTTDSAGHVIVGNDLNTNGTNSITTAATLALAVIEGNSPASVNSLLGTATNDDAAAGRVGEYVQSVIASGSAVSLVTTVDKNLTSISLTAGDWDVDAVFNFTGGATTTVNWLLATLSLTTNTRDNTLGRRTGRNYNASTIFNNIVDGIVTETVPPLRLSLSGTTTVYAVAQASFATSTCTVFGILRARRVR